MYMPSHFSESRVEVMHALIREHPLAVLVTLGPDGLNANHIPMEVDAEPAPFGTLRGHVARANPVWKDSATDVEALVIFQGPSGYVTPAWYATKRETGKVVPTYNYAVVHAYGPMRVVEEAAWLRDLVTRLTNRFESRRDEPWKVTDAPADFIAAQLRAIVGIEIPIRRLVGKWKMSQNRTAADRAGVVAGLEGAAEPDSASIAQLVEELGDRSEPHERR
jgi:transcriptional regulator